MTTPWGTSQQSTRYGDGITFCSTAEHGGFHVTQSLNDAMPPALRQESQWYEEDCESAKVILAFPDRFSAQAIAEARNSLRNWFPELYEAHFGLKLRPGESFVRDEWLFEQQHAAHWVTIAAWGDWHEQVPEGFVGVVATLGRRRDPSVTHRYFLIPKVEYDQRERFGFVIDLGRHQEMKAIR